MYTHEIEVTFDNYNLKLYEVFNIYYPPLFTPIASGYETYLLSTSILNKLKDKLITSQLYLGSKCDITVSLNPLRNIQIKFVNTMNPDLYLEIVIGLTGGYIHLIPKKLFSFSSIFPDLKKRGKSTKSDLLKASESISTFLSLELPNIFNLNSSTNDT